MGKRVICLICAAVMLLLLVFSVQAAAAPFTEPGKLLPGSGMVHLSKGIVKHSPNPLVSAMFLILAGIGISMLFDKKNKR